MIIGIDFGTCFSAVSVMSGMVPDTSLLRDDTGMGMPTVFLYDGEKGTEVFGDACESPDYYRRSGDVVRYVKRLVRRDPEALRSSVTSGGRSFTYAEIIERYLAFLVEGVKEAAACSGGVPNTEVEAVAVTVPVAISSGRMLAAQYNQVIHDAVKKATGLPDRSIFILEEPVAASLSYIYRMGAASGAPRNQTVLVFDLGGGTLDVTVLRYDARSKNSRILAKEGDLVLGGNDWDEVLARLVKRETGVSSFASQEEEARFARAVTSLKLDLSRTDEAGIFFKCGGKSKSVLVAREDFEAESEELVRRAMGVTALAVYRASLASGAEPGVSRDAFSVGPRGLGPDAAAAFRGAMGSVDTVVLVGGGSNMPSVREGLVSLLGIPEGKIVSHNPSKAICMGAGIYAKMMHGTSTSSAPSVTNIVSHAYGVDVYDDDGGNPRMWVLIDRGTPFGPDGRVTGSAPGFHPLRNNQPILTFNVLEADVDREGRTGSEVPLTDEMANRFGLTVRVPDRFSGRAREFRITITLTATSDGLLEITFVDDQTKEVLGTRTSLDS